jgi:hypothetical protein
MQVYRKGIPPNANLNTTVNSVDFCELKKLQGRHGNFEHAFSDDSDNFDVVVTTVSFLQPGNSERHNSGAFRRLILKYSNEEVDALWRTRT